MIRDFRFYPTRVAAARWSVRAAVTVWAGLSISMLSITIPSAVGLLQQHTRYAARLRLTLHSPYQRYHTGPRYSNEDASVDDSLQTYSAKEKKKRRREGMGKPKGYTDLSLRYIMENETCSGLPYNTSSSSHPYTILGIESSCDDTGVAVVRSDGNILSNVVYSQQRIHEKFGGIVPSLAMEAHKRNIDVALLEALQQAGLTQRSGEAAIIEGMGKIDGIAVTKGPGLEICLRVGIRKAQELARKYKKPFVTVHHLEAHCLMARLAGQNVEDTLSIDDSRPLPLPPEQGDRLLPFTPSVEFPFLVLLASGGHTSILLCSNLGDYTVLGGTLDDALGEAFDKAARLLGLQNASSGGAAIEAMAAQMDGKEWQSRSSITVPMRNKINCDFSYAGIKNAFRLAVQSARAEVLRSSSSDRIGKSVDENGDIEAMIASTNAPSNQMEEAPDPVKLPDDVTAQLCAEFQDVAFQHVEDRLRRALQYVQREGIMVNALVVVGGVAANQALRRRLLVLLKSHESALQKELPLIFPPPRLCTDNGVMAAWAGIEKFCRGISNNIEEQEAIPRWPLGVPLVKDAGNKRGPTIFSKSEKRKRHQPSEEGIENMATNDF